jgi:hypothetical protein
MTAQQYGFWDVCKSLSHQTGILYFNGRSVAARFLGMQKSNAYKLADSLKESGWFKLVKESHRRRDGTFSPKQYRVLSHDEWAAEHPNQCDLPVHSSGLDDDSPVHYSDSPVHPGDQPVHSSGHNLISTTDKNQPPKEPDNQEPFHSGGLDEFVERFSKSKRGRQRKAAAPHIPGPPVHSSGLDALGTQHEAERLSVAIGNTIGLSAETRAEWTDGIKCLLDSGKSPERVQAVAEFVHTQMNPGTLKSGGPTEFVRHFGTIEAAIQQQAGRTAVQ